MKKNYFLLLCSLLMSIALFTTSCSDDDTTPAEKPSFPPKQAYNAVAGQTIELSFSANYDWTATISQETYTYFQLLNGQTKTNTLNGVAGEHTISVAVADIPVYESVPTATVTLEMNGEEQVIAELHYPLSQRQLLFFAPQQNSYGGYKSGTYGGEYAYAYEETAMAEDAVLKTIYGVERGNQEESPVDTFFVPVMVQADFEYTLVGPEWMVATAAGKVGLQEHIIKADASKIPDNTATYTIEVLVAGTETVVGSFDVEMVGANDFIELRSEYDEYVYDYQGNPATYPFDIYYLVSKTGSYLLSCDANGNQVDWLQLFPAYTDSSSKIVEVETQISEMDVNEGAAREAYIFVFPCNVDMTYSDCVVDGEITAEAQPYAVGKIIQNAQPATIEAEVDDTCVTFSEIGPDFEYSWIFEEYVFNGKYFGSKYDVYYWGEFAKYGHELTVFTASRPVASLTAYSYTDTGSMAEASWVTTDLFTDTKFKIICDDPSIIPADAQNWQTGDYEAVIVVEYTDGSYSAIYFHFNENGGGSSSGEGGVAFVQPEYAGMMGASLVKLEPGNELYDTYFYEYSSDYSPADFYLLTYNFPIMDSSSLNMVALTGVEQYTKMYNSEWITWNADNSSITMDPAGVGEVGVVTFRDENWMNRVVILCQILSAE